MVVDMISPNEAVKMFKQFHDAAYREARTKWVPYWMNKLNSAVENAASNGRGDCRFELRWAEHLGINNIPSLLVRQYTERILDEEMARDTGFYIVNLSYEDSSIKKYRIVWYSEEYDAYKADRPSIFKKNEEEYDFN
jgi:hypothetical protein